MKEQLKTDSEIAILVIALTCSLILNFFLGYICHKNADSAVNAYEQLGVVINETDSIR